MNRTDDSSFYLNIEPPSGTWASFRHRDAVLAHLMEQIGQADIDWKVRENSDNVKQSKTYYADEDDCTYVTIDKCDDGKLDFCQVGISGQNTIPSLVLSAIVFRTIVTFQLTLES